MCTVQLEDFKEYLLPHSVKWSPNGKLAAFLVTGCAPDDMGYENYLWLYDESGLKNLNIAVKANTFQWENDSCILFPIIEKGSTVFNRFDLAAGKITQVFLLPIAAKTLYPVDSTTYAAVSAVDIRNPDVFRLSESERLKANETSSNNSDYVEISELPWWKNGGTYSSGKRNALFLFNAENSSCKRITNTDISVSEISVFDGNVYFTAADCSEPIRGFCHSLWLLKGSKLSCLCRDNVFSFRGLCGVPGGVVGSCCKNISEIRSFLLFRDNGGEPVLLNDYPEMIGPSVQGDNHRTNGSTMCFSSGSLFFNAAVRNAGCLEQLTLNGDITHVLSKEGSVDCFDVSCDGQILSVCMYDMSLPELYLLDNKQNLIQISHFNDRALEERYIAVPHKYTIRSEGFDIDGWVLEPAGYDPAKKYPALLFIHGGPKTCFGEVFFHEHQYFAGKGYFVFYCNPIGSSGRGEAFSNALLGHENAPDFQNLIDFKDFVLKEYPAIDSARLGVAGGSYGGYMTNWVVGHTDAFSCAVTERSISNWITYACTAHNSPFYAEEQTCGNLLDSPEKMWNVSPLKYVGNFSTPTLVIHSDQDYCCPVSEGYQMFAGLLYRHVESKMILFKGENHDLSRTGKPRHRVQRLQAISDWFDIHLNNA